MAAEHRAHADAVTRAHEEADRVAAEKTRAAEDAEARVAAAEEAADRARAEADLAATVAAADQLGGLEDGTDDDPLLPLRLTWNNFYGTVKATFRIFRASFWKGRKAAV